MTAVPSLKHYAVFGHPIAHSLSPVIHQAFARQIGIALDYRRIDAPPGQFAAAVRAFFLEGHGANVTLPHKAAAFALADERSAAARRAGSANVLTRLADGRLAADNTDGSGLVRDLAERRHFHLDGSKVLLLGAGGAARGVAGSLLDAGIAGLVIVNRSAEAAFALAEAAGRGSRAQPWEKLPELGRFDLILHATAAGVLGQPLALADTLADADTLCYDLSYGAGAASFLAWARATGAGAACDGLGMLLETAADSFALWHGQRPATAAVYDRLQAGAVSG